MRPPGPSQLKSGVPVTLSCRVREQVSVTEPPAVMVEEEVREMTGSGNGVYNEDTDYLAVSLHGGKIIARCRYPQHLTSIIALALFTGQLQRSTSPHL